MTFDSDSMKCHNRVLDTSISMDSGISIRHVSMAEKAIKSPNSRHPTLHPSGERDAGRVWPTGVVVTRHRQSMGIKHQMDLVTLNIIIN